MPRRARPLSPPAPADHVWGLVDLGDEPTVVVLPLAQAHDLVATHDALESSATWGELDLALPRRVRAELLALLRQESPRARFPPADRPLDLDEVPGFPDGDWPPFPPIEMASWVPDDLVTRFGELEPTVLNGDILYIPQRHAEAFIAALEGLGYPLRRDDALVTRACAR